MLGVHLADVQIFLLLNQKKKKGGGEMESFFFHFLLNIYFITRHFDLIVCLQRTYISLNSVIIP